MSPKSLFPFNSRLILSGPSGCGKSTFILKALEEGLFQGPITSIVICGPIQSSELAEKISHHLHKSSSAAICLFHEGLPALEDYDYWFGQNGCLPKAGHRILILDDLFLKLFACKDAATLFTVLSHHYGLSVVTTVHALRERSAMHLKICMQNASHLLVFRNFRGQRDLAELGADIFGPRGAKILTETYSLATMNRPHAYLIIDMGQNVSECRRFYSHVLKHEKKSAGGDRVSGTGRSANQSYERGGLKYRKLDKYRATSAIPSGECPEVLVADENLEQLSQFPMTETDVPINPQTPKGSSLYNKDDFGRAPKRKLNMAAAAERIPCKQAVNFLLESEDDSDPIWINSQKRDFRIPPQPIGQTIATVAEGPKPKSEWTPFVPSTNETFTMMEFGLRSADDAENLLKILTHFYPLQGMGLTRIGVTAVRFTFPGRISRAKIEQRLGNFFASRVTKLQFIQEDGDPETMALLEEFGIGPFEVNPSPLEN